MSMSKAKIALKEECHSGYWSYPHDKEKEIFDLIDKIQSTRDLTDWKEWMNNQFANQEEEEEVSYSISSSGRRMDGNVASNYF